MTAAKEELHVFSLAAFRLFDEKPRLGHQLSTAVLYPGIGSINSSTTTGIAASLYDFRGGPRCTGKERDGESGLDYFGARYMSSAQGRFTSADPKMFPHDFEDPQSWNKYGYTRNNPLRYVDPDGEDWKDYLTGLANSYVSDNAFGANRIRGGNSDLKTGQAVGDAVAAVQGTAETLAGIGGEAIGTLLDFTGIGAAVGIPVNIVSGAAILHGGSTAIMGAGNLSSVAFAVKANDAPGVTAGGQATDKFGNKLGPSGEPQINKTKSNTREAARNKALDEGSGATEHNNPQDGQPPHFHPTDAKGQKKPSSTHHSYPGDDGN